MVQVALARMQQHARVLAAIPIALATWMKYASVVKTGSASAKPAKSAVRSTPKRRWFILNRG